MTFFHAAPVVSGKPYPVRRVRGHVPQDLSDFTGQTSFALDFEGEDYAAWGAGVEAEDVVRVFEKDEQGYGKDIRVWTVRKGAGSGSFTAEQSFS